MDINGEGAVNTTSPFSIIVANTVKMNGNATITFNVDVDETDLTPPEELYYNTVEARITK